MNADNASHTPDLPPEVQSWLDDHPEADAETLEEVWQLSGEVLPTMVPDPQRVSAMREALLDATATDRLQSDVTDASQEPGAAPLQTNARSPEARARRTRKWGAWAAGTTLLVLLLAVSVYVLAVPAEVTVPAGQTQSVTLADGSRVELNSGTTLRYPRWWSVGVLRSWLGRSVQLEGEAFFSVTESGAPFRIETDNAEVRVLGTRFNVRARRTNGRPETRVVVAEGRVALTAAGSTTRLDSAQAATVRGLAPPSSSEDVPLTRALAWRQGGVSFTGASIQTVTAELERRFDVPIRVAAGVGKRPITLYVAEANGPLPLLRDACSVAGCRVDSTESGLLVRPR